MRRILLILPFLLLAAGSRSTMPPPVLAGIKTSYSFSTTELVRDVFIKGDCQNVSGIHAIGNNLSVGYFEGGNNIFGFQDGVILSSGDIKLAEGPNESVEAGESFGDNTVDPDITLFASNVAFDVAGIEFDFVPAGEKVTFRYVFASEEYCEFVGSIFNDVFGFFVSGPGITGPFSNNAINVAVLPGTSEYVAINSVNHNQNSASYIRNEQPEDADKCNIPFEPSHQDLIEYDGMTIPLTATIDVIPCETYHIRLLVADVGDDRLDSGVFLEMESFDLGGDVTVSAIVPGSHTPDAIEGCLDGLFVFTRSTDNLDNPLTVNFSIVPSSTAEAGIDFMDIPNSIVIPAGENSAALPITLIADGIAETQESLTLQLEFPCDCQDPLNATLFLNDETMMEVENAEINVCAGQEFTIGPAVLSGTEPFTFLWEDGSANSTITTQVDQITHFTVTITDACGSTGQATVAAIIQPVPNATLAGEITLCEGDIEQLEITFEGNPPWSFQYSLDGLNQQTITNVGVNPYPLTIDGAGTYELVSFTDAYCNGTFTGTALVSAGGAAIEIETTQPTCFNTEDGAININLIGGAAPYDIFWIPNVNDALNPTSLPAGTYNIQVTDAEGCISEMEINLTPASSSTNCQRFKMYVPNAFSPNNDGFNDFFQLFPAENSNIAQVKSLHIFNRWGAVVFEKTNFTPKVDEPLWDGKFKGKLMDAGVFIWQAVLQLEDGAEAITSGDLTLIR